MKWTLLLEGVLWVLTVWFIITQIAMPAWRNKPFFPIFRSAPRDANKKLSEAIEKSEIDATLKAADEISKAKKEK